MFVLFSSQFIFIACRKNVVVVDCFEVNFKFHFVQLHSTLKKKNNTQAHNTQSLVIVGDIGSQ